ncbi:MAG: hypothetical protein AAGD32_11320 [Planctomycetota bacterium]
MSKPTLEYEQPTTPPEEPSSKAALFAFFGMLAVFPLFCFGGSFLSTTLMPGDRYAGLTGMVYGTLSAAAIHLGCLVAGIFILTSRRGARERGLAHGMILAAAFALLLGGICFGIVLGG